MSTTGSDGEPQVVSFRDVYLYGMHNFQQFMQTGQMGYIDDSIAAFHAASEMSALNPSTRAACLSQLGAALNSRFSLAGDVSDLHGSVEAIRNAIEIASPAYEGRAGMLNNFAGVLSVRFIRLGDPADADAAITAQSEAVTIAPNDDARAMFMANLADDILGRFRRTAQLDDLNQSLKLIEDALELTPDDHRSRSARLAIFADALLVSFTVTGEIYALDTAVEKLQESIALTPPRHIAMSTRLSNLGSALFRRFERLKEMSDIDAAIVAHRQALAMMPDGHEEKGCTSVILSLSLQTRFVHNGERLDELTDIDEAIDAAREGIKLIPSGHAFEGGGFNALGVTLMSRFKSTQELKDIDDSIDAFRKAIPLAPVERVGEGRSMCLANMASALYLRYEHSNNPKDFDEAMESQRLAVDSIPDGHAPVARYKFRLARMKMDFLHHKGQISHTEMNDILTAFAEIAEMSNAPGMLRLEAAHNCLFLADANYPTWPMIPRVCEALMETIPATVWFGAKLYRRLEDLEHVKSSVGVAVSLGILAGHLGSAVEWFEHGRCIIWGQMLQLHTPLDDLRSSAPKLADELEGVSKTLSSTSADTDLSPHSLFNLSSPLPEQILALEESGRRHRFLANRYNALIEDARKVAGFEEFLKPAPIASLRLAALSGPVVLLNVLKTHCDALVLPNPNDDVIHVRLDSFNENIAFKMRNILMSSLNGHGVRSRGSAPATEDEGSRGFRTVLSLLWRRLVQPLLSAIEDTLFYAAVDDIPHITWCPTGSLSFLPIHAAGIYDDQEANTPKIYDFVVSSYTPSLSALANAVRKGQVINRGLPPKALAVFQASTPGQKPLPGTVQEMEEIRKHLPTVEELKGDKATSNEVLRCMQTAEWLHFACHAKQDLLEPTRSAFLLHDSQLGLVDIMRESFVHTELAVLSACQTATGDEKLPDEAIHLTAGMLMAGYRSVVGTMWSIADRDAPVIASEVYSHLMRTPVGKSRRTAYALHHATQRLRADVGDGQFVRWVPFIHLGI